MSVLYFATFWPKIFSSGLTIIGNQGSNIKLFPFCLVYIMNANCFFLLHIFLAISSVGSSLFFVSFLIILSWSLFALLASCQKSFVKCPFFSQLSHVVSRVGHIRDGLHQFLLFVFHRTFCSIILVLLPLDFFFLVYFKYLRSSVFLVLFFLFCLVPSLFCSILLFGICGSFFS